METIGDRIKKFAKDEYGSISELARACGLKETSFGNYINGRSKPGAEMQEKLREAGADIEWIMTGKKKVGEFKQAFLDAWKQSGLKPIGIKADKSRGRRIPVMLSPAHCGDFSTVYDDIDTYVETDRFLGENIFYIRATGESMTGANIREGDMLLVDVDREPKNGNIVLAQIGDTATVKRYKTNGEVFLLHPENPAFNPIPLTPGIVILAVVLKVEQFLVPYPQLKVWRNIRGKSNRILIFNEEESYLVVLEDRGTFILPWTAYLVDHVNRKGRLLAEYEAFKKAKAAQGH